MSSVLIPVIVVAGPTASGKSVLALELARRFDGEIVNCDSLQLYRGMDIGTAKPSPAEMEAVPHHLFDLLDPHEVFNAGEYATVARKCIREIHLRGKLPVVVGGTGFYLRALFDGLAPGPHRDDSLRTRLSEAERKRSGFLSRMLRRLDPAAAARIHGNDRNKLIRAIEICVASKASTGEMFDRGRDGFEGAQPLKLVLNPPREPLRQRIAARTRKMFDDGLLAETSGLWERGVPKDAKAFESIGYWQAGEMLDGRMVLAEALESVEIATRQYAKRQVTWFRKETGVVWLEGFGDDRALHDEAALFVTQFIAQFTVANPQSE